VQRLNKSDGCGRRSIRDSAVRDTRRTPPLVLDIAVPRPVPWVDVESVNTAQSLVSRSAMSAAPGLNIGFASRPCETSATVPPPPRNRLYARLSLLIIPLHFRELDTRVRRSAQRAERVTGAAGRITPGALSHE